MANILMVIPNLGMGGAQRSFAKLANWFSEEYEVSVVLFDDTYQDYYSMHVNLYTLGSPSASGIFNKLENFRKRAKRLKQLKKEIQPLATISFLEGADYLNLLSGPGGKRIVSIRGSKRYDPHITGFSGWIRKKILIPFLYRRANKIVAASKGLFFEMQADYPSLSSKLFVIANGYAPKETETKKAESPYFILTWAGRFGDEKGLKELLIVFAACFRKNNFFRLLLLGDGPYKETLKQFLAKENISFQDLQSFEVDLFSVSPVIFCNPGSHYEQYLAQGDLFLLTSPSEGFPNVIIEAMQQGLPVASSDCKWGPREILAPAIDYSSELEYPFFADYGILLPLLTDTRQIDKWKTVLLSIAENRGVINSYKERAFDVLSRYDEEMVKKLWFELLASE